jgi:branched-chain amino acid transport system substrate-binding protein
VAALADPVAVASGIPVLAVTNTTLDITAAGPTVWRICLGENQMIPASVTYARTIKGVRTAALVSVTGDAYSEGAAAQFRATAAAQGITLVADISMPQGSSTAPSVLATATAALPQAIFFAARDTDAINLLAASSDFTGVKVGGNGYNTPTVITASGASANGLIVSASWNPAKRDAASRAFVTAYARKYPGDQADAFAAQAYAGVQVLRAAVAIGNGTSARAVQRGLVRMHSAKTVLGTIRFPGNSREATYPATVQQVSAGVLKPTSATG